MWEIVPALILTLQQPQRTRTRPHTCLSRASPLLGSM